MTRWRPGTPSRSSTNLPFRKLPRTLSNRPTLSTYFGASTVLPLFPWTLARRSVFSQCWPRSCRRPLPKSRPRRRRRSRPRPIPTPRPRDWITRRHHLLRLTTDLRRPLSPRATDSRRPDPRRPQDWATSSRNSSPKTVKANPNKCTAFLSKDIKYPTRLQEPRAWPTAGSFESRLPSWNSRETPSRKFDWTFICTRTTPTWIQLRHVSLRGCLRCLRRHRLARVLLLEEDKQHRLCKLRRHRFAITKQSCGISYANTTLCDTWTVVIQLLYHHPRWAFSCRLTSRL